MDINNQHSLYRVEIDLVGFSSKTFLDGWTMTDKNLEKLNRALGEYPFAAVTSLRGSISSEDDNSDGDNKVYLAVVVLTYTATEGKAIANALKKVVEPVLAALPARGQFDMDGEADVLDSGIACLQDVADLQRLSSPIKRQWFIRSMKESSHIPIVA